MDKKGLAYTDKVGVKALVAAKIRFSRRVTNNVGNMSHSLVTVKRYVLVWDCESDSTFEDCPGTSHELKTRFMQFTVICAMAMPSELIERGAPTDEIVAKSVKFSWWRDEAVEGVNPIATLLLLLDNAELVVGYNCLGFDFPLIRRFYTPTDEVRNPAQRYLNHRCKTFDIMARLRDVTGIYYKLDDILRINRLETKSSNGKQAIAMWEAGMKDELQSYCEKDVLLTAKLGLLDSVSLGGNLRIHSVVFGVAHELSKRSLCPANDADVDFVVV